MRYSNRMHECEWARVHCDGTRATKVDLRTFLLLAVLVLKALLLTAYPLLLQ